MNDDTKSRLSTVPRCNLRNTYDATAMTGSPEHSSSWLKRPQNDIWSFSQSGNDFDHVVSSNCSPFPNAIPTCASPNLSPISTVTLECDATRMPELLPVASSSGLLSDITRDDYSGILLPGIQYQSCNEIYTVSLDDGTSSTFHRTVYIPIRKNPQGQLATGSRQCTTGSRSSGYPEQVSPRLPADDVNGEISSLRTDSTTSVDDREEPSQNPDWDVLPAVDKFHTSNRHNSKEEGENHENDQGHHESLEYTLGDFERTMVPFRIR